LKTLTMAWYVIATAVLRALPHPRWRAAFLRLLGASVGEGVRVHSCRFLNHELGFANLRLGEGVYVGADCLLDLAAPLQVGARATLSARCILLTHTDPGASHGNALAAIYPPSRRGCRVGADAWIGAGAVLVEGADVGERSAVGAGSVVTGALPADHLCVGQPARPVRTLRVAAD
jgi:acetyltransferase-like isoleucine patch superfamily enzyme